MNEEWMYYKHAICSKKIVRENSDLDFLKRKDIWSRKAWGGGYTGACTMDIRLGFGNGNRILVHY